MSVNLSEAGHSVATLPGSTIGKHDGHHESFLNCVALRHGWSRTFSISPEELAILDYHTLEQILEINTLRLRPMGLRVFVEHPPASGTWIKIRFWKHDTSLQSVLVKDFFEHRRDSGVITRLDIRDGSDRKDESDAVSLRTVGSRIVQTIHHRGESSTNGSAVDSSPQGGWLFGLRRRRASQRSTAQQSSTAGTDAEDGDEEMRMLSDGPVERPEKVSFFDYILPRPSQPASQRRSIFDFFSTKTKPLPETPPKVPTEAQKEAEVEDLRKRGWMPPGLARRQRSLRDHLRSGGNPFLGGGGGGSSRSLATTRSKKGKNKATEPTTDHDMDPFTDTAAAERATLNTLDEDAEVISQHDLDNFFEIERTTSNASGHKNKPWSRFKPRNRTKKGGKKGEEPTELGGAEVISQALDAFPDSPHRSRTSVARDSVARDSVARDSAGSGGGSRGSATSVGVD